MHIEVLGNYRIGREPWRLVEIKVSALDVPFDFDSLTLPVQGQPKDNWQVVWDERVLSADQQRGELHACFFLFVSSKEPLKTPAGDIVLPPPMDRPARLDWVTFEEPC